jgi:hypothetical protein
LILLFLMRPTRTECCSDPLDSWNYCNMHCIMSKTILWKNLRRWWVSIFIWNCSVEDDEEEEATCCWVWNFHWLWPIIAGDRGSTLLV